MLGHRLQATDGGLGRVDDFMIDDKAWTIHTLVVGDRNDTSSRVGIAPQHVDGISWPDARISLGSSRAEAMTVVSLR